MGPMFEQMPVFFQQLAQVFGPVGLIAREQDHMVGPFHRADTIHLYET